MSAAEKELMQSEVERQRKALLSRINIPEPEEVYYNLKPINMERAVALLESWCNVSAEEAEEQRETFEYLKRVLDEDRLSPDRKLFP